MVLRALDITNLSVLHQLKIVRTVLRRWSMGVAPAHNARGLGACVQAGKAVVVMIEIDVVILTQKYKLMNVIEPKVIQWLV